MKSLWKFIRATRTLDEGKPGRCDREQAMIHSLLQSQGEHPVTTPPPHLRRRIAARLEDAPAPVLVRQTVWDRPAIAALLLLGVGGAWGVLHMLNPAQQPPRVAAPRAAVNAIPASYSNRQPTLVTVIRRPLAEEARDIEQDARDAVNHVLEFLPLDPGRTASRE